MAKHSCSIRRMQQPNWMADFLTNELIHPKRIGKLIRITHRYALLYGISCTDLYSMRFLDLYDAFFPSIVLLKLGVLSMIGSSLCQGCAVSVNGRHFLLLSCSIIYLLIISFVYLSDWLVYAAAGVFLSECQVQDRDVWQGHYRHTGMSWYYHRCDVRCHVGYWATSFMYQLSSLATHSLPHQLTLVLEGPWWKVICQVFC